MRKELFLTSLCSLTVSGVIHAETTNSDLYLFLGGTSSATSVSTSMHDAGSAAASYTLGGGGNNGVQTTTGSSSSSGGGGNASAYEESKYDSPSSSGSSSAPTRRRRASGGSSSSSAAPYTPSYSAKGAKGGIIPAAYDPSPLIITADAGYQSQYVYNGINRIRLSVYTPNGGFGSSTRDFDMYYLGAGVKWKGLSFGLKYIRSLDSDMNPLFHPSAAKKSAYSEYVADLNYTLGLIAGPQGSGNWLDATVGYEFTYFEEDTFWNTDTQQKYYASLKVNRYKWVRPSVTYQSIDAGSSLTSVTDTWIPGFDMLSGEQVIFQVDGGDVVLSTGNVEVGVGYYVKTGHASGYNKVLDNELNGDWYQAGVNIPISFGDFTVTPSVHYTENDAKLVKEPGFWWGINAKYTF